MSITIDFNNISHIAALSFLILFITINAVIANDDVHQNVFSIIVSFIVIACSGLVFIASLLYLVAQGFLINI